MNSPEISMIVAVGLNNEIGKKGQLIWHISEDLKRFKKLTWGGVLIMGRKTYESIGKPLPGRINVVITRQKKYPDDGIWIFQNPMQALEKAKCFSKPVFIIGGEQIYKQLLPFVQKIYLTHIHAEDKEADAFFPAIENEEWKLEEQSAVFFDKENKVNYEYQIWLRHPK